MVNEDVLLGWKRGGVLRHLKKYSKGYCLSVFFLRVYVSNSKGQNIESEKDLSSFLEKEFNYRARKCILAESSKYLIRNGFTFSSHLFRNMAVLTILFLLGMSLMLGTSSSAFSFIGVGVTILSSVCLAAHVLTATYLITMSNSVGIITKGAIK